MLAARCWFVLAFEYDDEVGNSGVNKTVVVLQPGISTSAQVSIMLQSSVHTLFTAHISKAKAFLMEFWAGSDQQLSHRPLAIPNGDRINGIRQ